MVGSMLPVIRCDWAATVLLPSRVDSKAERVAHWLVLPKAFDMICPFLKARTALVSIG